MYVCTCEIHPLCPFRFFGFWNWQLDWAAATNILRGVSKKYSQVINCMSECTSLPTLSKNYICRFVGFLQIAEENFDLKPYYTYCTRIVQQGFQFINGLPVVQKWIIFNCRGRALSMKISKMKHLYCSFVSDQPQWQHITMSDDKSKNSNHFSVTPSEVHAMMMEFLSRLKIALEKHVQKLINAVKP